MRLRFVLSTILIGFNNCCRALKGRRELELEFRGRTTGVAGRQLLQRSILFWRTRRSVAEVVNETRTNSLSEINKLRRAVSVSRFGIQGRNYSCYKGGSSLGGGGGSTTGGGSLKSLEGLTPSQKSIMHGAKLAKTRIVMLDGIPCYSDSAVLKVLEFRDLRKNLTNEYPFGGPQRVTIPEEKMEWGSTWAEYDPPEFTTPGILKGDKEWADKELRLTDVGLWPKWNQQDGGINRRSHHGNYYTDADGYPLNPAGRTGMKGRGSLGRWATNHAADCLITRWKRSEDGSILERDGHRVLQFIGIIRKDTGDAAFPGGMIDAGEDAMTAVKREFLEEVFNIDEATEEERSKLEDSLQDVFSTGETVYKGYVDDRRNTDNAWIETEAINFFLSKGEDEDLFQNLKFKAGSDASGALWIDVDQNVKLHASHKSIIQILVQKLNAYW